ncbi:MAG TPA: response regulator [bacterium]|nr:response regulator [bacterium]
MATDRLTILMIDDDPDDITIVRGLLERVPVWTVDLIGCLNAGDAVQQTLHRKPDLILLDFNFGAFSGLDVLPSLRGAGYQGPVVLLSGCGQEELATMVRAGLSDFLSKDSLSSLTLYHAITLALEKRQLPQRGNRSTSPRPSSTTPLTTSSRPPFPR